MDMLLRILVICISFLSLDVNASGLDGCEHLGKQIYLKFREYRNDINNEYAELWKYFSRESIKKYGIVVDKDSVSESEKKKTFQFLNQGVQVKIVYGYDVNCISNKKIDLLLYTDSYYVMTKSKIRDTRTVVTIKYTYGEDDWEINGFIYDSREQAKSKVIRKNAIDIYD